MKITPVILITGLSGMLLFSICVTGQQTKVAEKQIMVPACKEDSLRKVNDSLKTRLFLAEYKIQRVKYYLHIAINKPSQRKFLTSWISRAVQ